MSQIQINWQAFNRRDLKTGRWKCRLCEKPAEPPKEFYCSDEHRKIFDLATSWAYTRRLVLERDEHTCVKCKKVVASHYHTYDYEQKKFVYSKEIANVHHVIPVAYLWIELLKAVEGLEGSERAYRLEQLKVIVFFHLDNLITLCEECHKKEHKSGWYKKYKMKISGQKTITDFSSRARPHSKGTA